MSTNVKPSCPVDCTFQEPETTFDFCKSDIHTGEGEILYLAAPNAECFSDVTSLAEWTARISNDSLDPNAIRRLRVVADMPAGSGESVDISLGQKYYGEKSFTINVEIEDNSPENYILLQLLHCNSTHKAWLQTAGGDLLGGVCGLSDNGVSIDANYVIEKGQNSMHKQM
jgi:hypothetical protein